MRGSALALALVLTSSVTALAQEKPKTYVWMLDAMLNARTEPPTGKLIDGDFLVVTVDPTRLFGADRPSGSEATLLAPKSPTGSGAFLVRPEARAFYVAAPEAAHYQLQPGACTPDAPLKSSSEALACVEERFAPGGGWPLPEGFKVYRCPEVTDLPLDKRLKQGQPNPWSLVIADGEQAPECVKAFPDIQAGLPSVKEVEVLYARAGLPPERVAAVIDKDGRWNANVTLRAGTAEVLVRVKFGNGQAQEGALPQFEVASRDTHSQVRVQAELLAANRLRTVSLAVAVTPVSKRFFTDGPWSSKTCHLGCSTGPMVLLKIAGDTSSLVQFGVGWSVFLTRSLHVNGGLLFGTRDLGTRWEPSRNWFLGISIDPVLLSEARTAEQ